MQDEAFGKGGQCTASALWAGSTSAHPLLGTGRLGVRDGVNSRTVQPHKGIRAVMCSLIRASEQQCAASLGHQSSNVQPH